MKKIGVVIIITFVVGTLLFAQTTSNRTNTIVKNKYEYAMLNYADKWDRSSEPHELWVSSRFVSDETKAKVQKAKYNDAALNILGAEGWELVNVINERMDYGTAYIHYLKRAVN